VRLSLALAYSGDGWAGLIVLEQVAAQVRDLEIAVVVGAAAGLGQDVIDGCRERVITSRG
jgi:hypothetical protein